MTTTVSKHAPCGGFLPRSVMHYHGVPKDLAMEKVTPVHLVCGDVHVQCHGVFQCRHHLRVVPPHQVDPSDLVSVGEHQVWTLTCVEDSMN